MKKNKVLVLGLDGVEPKLFKWAKENKLPNIAKLLNSGAYGNLKSTMPPLSAIAWPSFYTGTNPGKHGVFGAQQITSEGFKVVSFKSVSGKSLWKIMTENDKKVIVIAVPITYPPENVNGILISGMDTPSEEANFTYPKDLKEELKRAGYRIFVNRSSYSRPETLYKEAVELMWKKADIALKLMKENEWDFFMLVLNETDVVAHFLPERTFDCYKEADKIVGKFLAEIDKKTSIILMSDHGNIPFQGSIHLHALLRQRVKEDKNFAGKIATLAGLLLVKAGRARIRYRSKAVDRIAKLIGRILAKTKVTEIKYRAKNTHISDSTIYVLDKSMKEQVFNTLCEFSEQYGFEVFKREDIYSGKFVDKAPDFVVFSEKYIPCPGYAKKTIVGPPKRPGWHTLFGIVTVSGIDIRNIEIDGTQIVDLAPTILHLMGLPVPEEMDGRVLQEIFAEDSEAYKRPIRYQRTSEREKIRAKILKLKMQRPL